MKERSVKANVEAEPRPDWIRIRGVRADVMNSMREKLDGCNTVCLSAKCPNLGECFSHGVATFMIGGSYCTRACRFCGVRHGKPEALDAEEPSKVAASVKRLGLKFVVVTGVARDDLDDGGASHYAETANEIHRQVPGVGVEVLIPDFGGKEEALRTVLESYPVILNHNVETVRRLTPSIRSKATYEKSLSVLRMSREIAPEIPTKSGLMVGLGESWDEVIETLEDLRNAGCSMLTVGQYLQPRAGEQVRVDRYWTPEEFEELKSTAIAMRFRAVASGPFVRSSYLAERMAEGVS